MACDAFVLRPCGWAANLVFQHKEFDFKFEEILYEFSIPEDCGQPLNESGILMKWNNPESGLFHQNTEVNVIYPFQDSGFFDKGVYVRRVGRDGADFVDVRRIDFDLYTWSSSPVLQSSLNLSIDNVFGVLPAFFLTLCEISLEFKINLLFLKLFRLKLIFYSSYLAIDPNHLTSLKATSPSYFCYSSLG